MINFFSPKSIAIVGASKSPFKLGNLVVKNLLNQGFKGEIFLVNKKGGDILGRKVYENLSQIKKQIDLVVLAIPADGVIEILDEIGKLGIKNLLIFAAGFKEVGEEGLKKEKLLIEKSNQYGFNILGPNCVGFVNTRENINLTFLRGKVKKGNIGIISQSGALGSFLVDYFNQKENLGFSYFFSVGNKTKINEIDLLNFLAEDKNTKVIGCYFESVENGKKFKEEIKKITKKKPVVILKSGKSKQGAKAALSHTGSIVGDDDIYEAVFSQTGVIRAENLEEFLLILKIFSFEKVPLGDKLLILTNAGGVGVLMVDEVVKNNLKTILISEQVKEEIIKKLPNASRISIHNPIDLLGDAKSIDFQTVLGEALKDINFDIIVVLLTPQANTEIERTAEVIVNTQLKTKIPIYPVFLGGKSVQSSLDYFDKNKVVGLDSFYFLTTVIKKIVNYQNWLKREKANVLNLDISNDEKKKIDLILQSTQEITLNVSKTFNILKILKLPIVNFIEVKNLSDLKKANLNYPLVAKINSDKISHKTDVGGVVLNINNYQDLEKAYLNLSKIDNNLLIQSMIKGDEFIFGTKKDNVFGTVVIFGLGGVYTEVFKEVIKLVYPFSFDDFINQLENKRFYKLLKGVRGKKEVDLHKIYDLLFKLGYLTESFQISEIDLNPVIIKDGELNIVDGRIIK
ncbi:MAG: acetyl-CoA synthetase [Patescibacteria group bacterium]|nr:MAG: acetyl-CoA synthetase [Patescibacteria group bacterium]